MAAHNNAGNGASWSLTDVVWYTAMAEFDKN